MLRNLIIERIALPLSCRVTHTDFWKLARRMERLERQPRGEIRSLQNERLQRLFDVAVEQTDFWKLRLADVNHNQDDLSPLERLQTLPLTSKSDLESGFPDQVVNRSAEQSDLRFAATRGTTQRMICVHDFAKRESIRAAMVRTLHAAGYRLGMPMVEIPPDICDVVCGDLGESDEGVLRHVWTMFRKGQLRDANAYRDLRGLIERHWIYHRKTYPSFGAAGSNPNPEQLDGYIKRLQSDRPYLVKGLTTYLYQIAKRILQRDDVNLKIPVIKPLGSGATPTMRETIETAFGGKFHDDYGSAELGSIACDCELNLGMHIFADLFIVEIVDGNGLPVPDGQTGEVVVTDLVNHAMPLIRYRIGDLGKIDNAPCNCGRTVPRLQIEGRRHDAITNSQGDLIPSHTVAERLFRETWLDQFQLIEKRGNVLEVTVTPAEGYDVDTSATERIVSELIGDDRKIRVRSARTIAAEPGGKFRWVKALPPKSLEHIHGS